MKKSNGYNVLLENISWKYRFVDIVASERILRNLDNPYVRNFHRIMNRIKSRKR